MALGHEFLHGGEVRGGMALGMRGGMPLGPLGCPWDAPWDARLKEMQERWKMDIEGQGAQACGTDDSVTLKDSVLLVLNWTYNL